MEEEDSEQVNILSRNVWLLKVPSRFGNWKTSTASSKTIGKLRIHSANPGERPKVTFHLEEDEAEKQLKPGSSSASSKAGSSSNSDDMRTLGRGKGTIKPCKDFALTFLQDVPTMRIFSVGDGGVEFQGIVEESCVLQPQRSAVYDKLLQERHKQATRKDLFVKEMTHQEEIQVLAQKRPLIKIAKDDIGKDTAAASKKKKAKTKTK